jgi:transcriptional regulator of acetoin/glycerol metabolism
LASGNEIEKFDLPELMNVVNIIPEKESGIKTMEEMERDHILTALKACSNKVFGVGGAAEMLNIPPATLYSKMKKLGIKQGFS